MSLLRASRRTAMLRLSHLKRIANATEIRRSGNTKDYREMNLQYREMKRQTIVFGTKVYREMKLPWRPNYREMNRSRRRQVREMTQESASVSTLSVCTYFITTW